MKQSLERLDEASRRELSKSLWAFYRGLESSVAESLDGRAVAFRMSVPELHPVVEGTDRVSALWGAQKDGGTRPWWKDLARLEVAGLVRARHEGFRIYEPGACIAAYREALGTRSSEEGTEPGPSLLLEGGPEIVSEAALSRMLAQRCQAWALEDQSRLGSDAARKISLMLTGHPSLSARLIAWAIAEADNFGLGYRELLSKK